MAFHGADVDDLDRLAKELKSAAQATAAARSQLASAVSRLGNWTGQDAARFKHQWNSSYSPNLLRISGSLTDASTHIARHSQEQKTTSNNSNSASMAAIFAAQAAFDAAGRFPGGLRAGISGLPGMGSSGPQPNWVVDADGKVSYDALREDFYRRPLLGEKGEKQPFEPQIGVQASLLDKKPVEFWEFGPGRRTFLSKEGRIGGVNVEGSLGGHLKSGGLRYVDGGLNQDGAYFTAGAHYTASTGLHRAVEIGAVRMERGVSGKFDIGADADIGLGRRPSGNLGVGASVKAGFSASLERSQSLSVGDFKGNATGALSAGLDAEAKAEGKYHNGKVSVEWKLGATLGVGGKVGGNVEIPVGEAVRAAKKLGGLISRL